jgi:hypothetical protein
MIRNTSYRLTEYKIIENAHGDFWWETHFGFGSLKGGKCFIRGNILFIEPSNREESGFLKGEFLDNLDQLPKWEKTKYYCSSDTIYNCKSGRKLPLEEMGRRSSNLTAMAANRVFPGAAPKKRINAELSDTTEDISYKLGRYEIIEKNNGQVRWESHGLSSAKGGKCSIEGSILFIGPSKTEKAGFLKREFMERLNRLPEWKKTKYYCPRSTIYYCKTGRISRELGVDEELGKKTSSKNNVVSKEAFDPGTIAKPIAVTKVITKAKENVIGTCTIQRLVWQACKLISRFMISRILFV